MIKAFLIFNTSGKPRLLRFYEYKSVEKQKDFLQQLFHIVSHRSNGMCNFVDLGKQFDDCRLIYKAFATLYFAVIVDSSESELAMMDVIQSFVETLDKCFKNICELDIIFHSEQVYQILDEMIVGGLVAETGMTELLAAYNEQRQLDLAEKPLESLSAEKLKEFFRK